MNMSVASLRRPIFFAALVILMLVAGFVSMRNIPVDMMPKLDVPYVVIVTEYPGAGPKEVETVITTPLEEELVSLEGIKNMNSTSQDSISQIVMEFKMGLPPDTLEQKVRDRISVVKMRFPKAVKESYVQKWDPSAQSILTLAIRSDKMDRVKLTDWVERDLKPQLAQIPKVGKLDILGGLKREIHVVLDSKKLEQYRMPLITVADEISRSGENAPGGTVTQGSLEVGVRNLGEYSSLDSIRNRVISFPGGEVPVRLSDLGQVENASEKETTRAYHKNQPALIVNVYRQSGANIIEITDLLKKRIADISQKLEKNNTGISVEVVVDGAKEIRDNVWDVQESIMIGILLTILVVYLFLASARSTLITGLALPNSILGAFVLMYMVGFSINIMTLLALSLAVGLLVDDAIVVRENIFKHLETGKSPVRAAIDGVQEVSMAVIATTFAILAVFGPVAFISGMIGQFFREFGMTVCFAMLISLFDALTVAPMLSAYWGGNGHGTEPSNNFFAKLGRPFAQVAANFGKLQDRLEVIYGQALEKILARPKTSSAIGIAFAISLFFVATRLPATFTPQAETSSIDINVTLPPGTRLDDGDKYAQQIKAIIDRTDGVKDTVLTIGNSSQESNVITARITLKPPKERKLISTKIRDLLRAEVEKISAGFPKGTETKYMMGNASDGGSPVNFAILANTSEEASAYASKLLERLKKSPLLADAHSTAKMGRPEIVVKVDPKKAARFGINEGLVGSEVRGRIEGIIAARYRDNGREYDIKVKLKDGAESFLTKMNEVLVPNINMTPIRLKDVANVEQGKSVAKLERTNRSASVSINANLPPKVGLAEATGEIKKIMEKEVIPPSGIRILYQGDAESFAEMGIGFATAMGFGIILLYLILASLYESFFLPILVMSALPLAAGGAFVALLLAGQGFDIYSMIGILLLMGVATKNSILMVDTVVERLRERSSVELSEYVRLILDSCVRRLRPIIMTSMALIAGMIPIAVGLNEASAQRTSMGTAVIGGTISSTALTLLLVPALLLLFKGRVQKAAVASAKRNKLVDQAIEDSQAQS